MINIDIAAFIKSHFLLTRIGDNITNKDCVDS